jgi:hypothetical protein
VKIFALYTAARAGLFLACWAAIWLIIGAICLVTGSRVEWDSLSALSTAMVALIASSVIALTRLRTLRERFAADVAVRAERASAAFNARRSAEDFDEPQAQRPVGDVGTSAGGADHEPREQS